MTQEDGVRSVPYMRGPTPIRAHQPHAQHRLSLTVESCGGDPDVGAIEETSAEVRLLIVATTPTAGIGWACLDSLGVQLAQPLGGRRVIDLTTGQLVPREGG